MRAPLFDKPHILSVRGLPIWKQASDAGAGDAGPSNSRKSRSDVVKSTYRRPYHMLQEQQHNAAALLASGSAHGAGTSSHSCARRQRIETNHTARVRLMAPPPWV